MVQFYETESTYRLGNVSFKVVNCDEEYEQKLNRLLPLDQACGDDAEPVSLKLGCSKRIDYIVSQVISHHQNCIIFGGTALLSPDGRKVVLAGPAKQDRHAVSLELCSDHGWKLISHGFVLIDRDKKTILLFHAPIALKWNEFNLVKQRTTVRDLIEVDWHPKRPNKVFWARAQSLAHDELVANFDLAIYLDEPSSSPVVENCITGGSLVRKILPDSNFLSHPGASDLFYECISHAACKSITGGDSPDRVKFAVDMLRATAESPTKSRDAKFAVSF